MSNPKSILTAIILATILLCFPVTDLTLGQSTAVEMDSDLPPRPRDEIAPVNNSGGLNFVKKGGVVYCRRDDEDLKCDLYIPEGKGPFPAVIAVHGGAWRSGSKLHLIRHGWRFAARGYVLVAINYRHSPTHKFPAQIHDCKTAVRWMRKNAEKYKIDPDRIAGFGYSAGGNIVALAGTAQPDDGLEGNVPDELKNYSSELQAFVVGGAPCEFSWVGNRTLSYWLGSSRSGNPEIYQKASPTSYLDANDPPCYLFHGTLDAVVPMSTTKKMKAKLDAMGVKSKLVLLPSGHMATFTDLKSLSRAIDFLDASLSPTTKE